MPEWRRRKLSGGAQALSRLRFPSHRGQSGSLNCLWKRPGSLVSLLSLYYRMQGCMPVSVVRQSSLQRSSEVICCSAGHNYIGTEHVLLGLLREGEGVAARVLETLGADPQKIRSQVSLRPLPWGGVRLSQASTQHLWPTYVWHCRSSGWLGRVRRQWAWVQAQGPAATRCPRWKSMGQISQRRQQRYCLSPA